MYVAGRVISLAIFSLILILICYGITKGSVKKGKRLLTFYIIALGIMGYCFIPHSGADLTRLITTMTFYASQSLKDLLPALLSSTTPGTVAYFYIIGKFGNHHLLPALSAIITYSFCFALLKKEYNNCETKSVSIATALFAFMSRGMTMQVISNIRTIMSLSICAWCVYKEFYEKERVAKLVVFYLLAASLHLMGQIMLLYRVVFFVIDRGKSPAQKIFHCAVAAVLGFAIWQIGRRYIIDLFAKADSYFSYAQAGTSYSYIWEKVLSIMSLILMVYLVWLFRKYRRKLSNYGDYNEQSTESLLRYVLPLLIIDILIMPIEFNFFQRMSWFLTIITIPIELSVVRMAQKIGTDRIIINNIWIYSVLMLALACIRGDLCSLKFFQI